MAHFMHAGKKAPLFPWTSKQNVRDCMHRDERVKCAEGNTLITNPSTYRVFSLFKQLLQLILLDSI